MRREQRPGQTPIRDEWRRQLAAAITSPGEALDRLRPGASRSDHEAAAAVARQLPVRIPPYYAALIDPDDPDDPLAKMVLPDGRELLDSPWLEPDPLAEESHTVVPRLVHRYRDRALLLVTYRCASYCRHCTRRRLTGRGGVISTAELAAVVQYLRAHPEVKDLLLSGGDPLLLPDPVLGHILDQLRTVPSLEVLRIGTRVPAVLPSRVTPELAARLGAARPLYVSTHFNHPREVTAAAVAACGRLVDAGIPLANQTVLLAGVNDRHEIIEELCRALLRARVRPYYLLQSDLVAGLEHLRTPLARGLEIMETLRGRLSGLALPTFVVDGPGGTGKIPLTPSYLVSWAPGRTVLRNFEGQLIVYPDPVAQPTPDGGGESGRTTTPAPLALAAADPQRPPLDGVAGLLAGTRTRLTPGGLEREARYHAPAGAAVAPAAASSATRRAVLCGLEPGGLPFVADWAAPLQDLLRGRQWPGEWVPLGTGLAGRLAASPPTLILPLARDGEVDHPQLGQLASFAALLGVACWGPAAGAPALLATAPARLELLRGHGLPVAGPSSGSAAHLELGLLGDEFEPLLPHDANGQVDAESSAGALSLAQEAARALGCRDACRVLLVARDGEWRIADLDPWPDLLSPEAPLPRLADRAGLGHAELLRRAFEPVLRRAGV